MAIKWGILGAGQIAEKFLSDLSTVENAEAYAIVSKTPKKAKYLADKYSISRKYSTYYDFVKDTEIEAVYIATPHNFHFEQTKLCLENKKAVLCEKPITVNMAQLTELQAIAAQNKVLLMEAMWTYFLPAIIKAKEWIDSGKIGEINLIKAEFGFKAEFNPENRLYNPDLAGGALLDIGIYPIAFAHFFAKGNTKSIKSHAKVGHTKIDEYNSISIEYQSGEIAVLNSSILSTLKNDGIIYGSKGHIQLSDFWKAKKAILHTEKEIITFEDKRETWGYDYEAHHFGNLLEQQKTQSKVVSFEISRQIMQTMDEVRKQNNIVYPFE